jgi:hypothetical protein
MIGAVIALVIASIALHWPDGVGMAGGAAIALALGIGMTLLAKRPAAIDFVAERPRMFMTLGVAIAALAFGASIAVEFGGSPIRLDAKAPLEFTAVLITVIGIIVARAPSLMRRLQVPKAQFPAAHSGAAPPQDFRAIGEAMSAARSVVAAWPVFLQVAGPWIALLCAVAIVIGWLGAGASHDRGRAGVFLLTFIVSLLGFLYVALPTIAVAWFRWTLEAKRPGRFFAIPDRSAFGIAWRLFAFLAMVGTADRLLSGLVAKLAGASNSEAAEGILELVVMIAAIAAVSIFALRLPAIAVRDQAFTYQSAIIQGRRLGPALPLGLILSLAPFIGACLVEQVFADRYLGPVSPRSDHIDLPRVAYIAALLTTVLAAVASGATFLSRAYLKAKGNLVATKFE